MQYTKSNNILKTAKLEKIKKERLKLENQFQKTTIASFQDIDLMNKLYLEYVICLIVEVRCKTKDKLKFGFAF